MACGQKMALLAIKVTVATPLITPPSMTFSLFMAWMSVMPSAESIQVHDADSSAEIAAVDGHQEFEERSEDHCPAARLGRDALGNASGEMLAERKEDRK